MQDVDGLDGFLGRNQVVDGVAIRGAADTVEGEFARESSKLGLPSDADEGISGLCPPYSATSFNWCLLWCAMLWTSNCAPDQDQLPGCKGSCNTELELRTVNFCPGQVKGRSGTSCCTAVFNPLH